MDGFRGNIEKTCRENNGLGSKIEGFLAHFPLTNSEMRPIYNPRKYVTAIFLVRMIAGGFNPWKCARQPHVSRPNHAKSPNVQIDTWWKLHVCYTKSFPTDPSHQSASRMSLAASVKATTVIPGTNRPRGSLKIIPNKNIRAKAYPTNLKQNRGWFPMALAHSNWLKGKTTGTSGNHVVCFRFYHLGPRI